MWVLAGYALVVVVGAVVWALNVVLANPVSGDLELVHSDAPGVRVLLVANRLTSDNGMADMLRKMAARDPGGEPLFVVQYARRHSTLDRALDDSRLRDLLDDERWDYVVLQEHSGVASRPPQLATQTLPAVLALNAMARQRGARTVLFQTWGYEDGERGRQGDSYDAMQSRLIAGYRAIQGEVSATIAPAGRGWQLALSKSPTLDLYTISLPQP